MIVLGIILIWTISIGTVLKYTLSHELLNEECFANFKTGEEAIVYLACWMIIMTLIPFIIMTATYLATAIELNRNKIKHANNQAMKARVKENKRVVNMFLIVVTSFFFLTAPYAIYYFVSNYLLFVEPNDIDRNVLLAWNYGLFIVSVLNSCVNPIIYGKMHREVNRQIRPFFKPLRKLFSGCVGKLALETHDSYALSSFSSSTTSFSRSDGKINFAFKLQ